MDWKIEIRNRNRIQDPLAGGIKKDIQDLGIRGVTRVTQAQVFIVSGDISRKDVQKIAKELLADPITQEYVLAMSTPYHKGTGQAEHRAKSKKIYSKARVVEIAYNPGVMDPVEESTKKAIRDMGIYGVELVKTGRKYFIEGSVKEQQFKKICEKLLYNKVIQHIVEGEGRGTRGEGRDYNFKLITVDILGANDKKLKKISKAGQLFLNLKEMKAIQGYFKKIGRNPTDCELETIAQTWSEHCGHKTFRGVIEYKEISKGHRAKGIEQRAKGKGRRAKSKIQRVNHRNVREKFVILRLRVSQSARSSSIFEASTKAIFSKTRSIEASSKRDRRAMFKNWINSCL